MKNNKTVLGTVEKITLGDIEFLDDSIQILVDIKDVSENLQARIMQTMEEAKANSSETMQQLYGRDWNETQVYCLSLNIVANKNKTMETSIVVYFEEVEDSNVFDSGEFKIDLTGFETELKCLVVAGVVNKFFG